jgi:indole-3-glycerol phosphate synthase
METWIIITLIIVTLAALGSAGGLTWFFLRRRAQRRASDNYTKSLIDESLLAANLEKQHTTGIIAEFKRMSPSKGIINDKASVKEVTAAYHKFGAAGISVLTDTEFFGGSLDDLSIAVKNEMPVLRKEFIIDEFQIIEAKA